MGPVYTVISGLRNLDFVHFDARAIYYAMGTGSLDGAVYEASLVGGTPQLIAGGQDAPAHADGDADSIVWTNSELGSRRPA